MKELFFDLMTRGFAVRHGCSCQGHKVVAFSDDNYFETQHQILGCMCLHLDLPAYYNGHRPQAYQITVA